MKAKLIDRLKEHRGIASEFLANDAKQVVIAEEYQQNILKCMGYALDDSSLRAHFEKLDEAQRQRVVPEYVLSSEAEPLIIEINLPCHISDANSALALCIEDKDAERKLSIKAFELLGHNTQKEHIKDSYRYQVNLGKQLAPGRHSIKIHCDGFGELAQVDCLIAPGQCYEPEDLAAGKKISGTTMQLYTLRSDRNWGMGDFTDLKNFIVQAASEGIDIVGLNPMHALFPANPHHFSPYSPSNRSFINVLYIDPMAIPEFKNCSKAQEKVADEGFQNQVQQLRAGDKVDYPWVSSLKFKVFESLFDYFSQHELSTDNSARRIAYQNFLAEQGEALELHALYDALHEHFFAQDTQLWGWPVWPEAYRQPNNKAVLEFREHYGKRVAFYKYLQFCAWEQMRDAQLSATQAGMSIGVYLDLAVGVDMAGSEVWANQKLFCLEASVGAPPDALASGGQDWGFPPFDPLALKEDAYKLLRQNLRASMSCAGAVRFDHCVSFMRLWWIPKGCPASEGGYVQYSLSDILNVLAIESNQHQCLVIGEDLGTVPEQLTSVMRAARIYSYKVLYFEKDWAAERYTPAAEYVPSAVATVTTHDLATLISWWNMTDIEIRKELDLLPSDEFEQGMIEGRIKDKQQLVKVLIEHDCLPADFDINDGEQTEDFMIAAHKFLAISRSAIMISQLEDWLQMDAPINIPGTYKEYPNWQRKLEASIENFFDRTDVQKACSTIRAARSVI